MTTPDEIRELIAWHYERVGYFSEAVASSRLGNTYEAIRDYHEQTAKLLERYLLPLTELTDSGWFDLSIRREKFTPDNMHVNACHHEPLKRFHAIEEDLGDALTKAMNAMQDKEDS